jgi:hypothetical protein
MKAQTDVRLLWPRGPPTAIEKLRLLGNAQAQITTATGPTTDQKRRLLQQAR